MLQAMAPLRLDVAPEPAPVDATSPGDAILELCTVAEAGYGGAFKALFADLPPVEGVTSSTETIRGVDGRCALRRECAFRGGCRQACTHTAETRVWWDERCGRLSMYIVSRWTG